MKNVHYTVERGAPWKRLIVIKDRYRHRRRVPTEAAASLRIPDGELAGDYVIPTEINWEGAVLLSMSAGNTEWLPEGEYEWDMVATYSESALFTSTPLVETVVVKGTISVSGYDNITPMDSDGAPVPLELVG